MRQGQAWQVLPLQRGQSRSCVSLSPSCGLAISTMSLTYHQRHCKELEVAGARLVRRAAQMLKTSQSVSSNSTAAVACASTELTCSTLQTARCPVHCCSPSGVSCSAPAPAADLKRPTGLQTASRPLLPKKESCMGCPDPFQGSGMWRSDLSWRVSHRLRCSWLLTASREPSGLTAMCSMGPSAGRQ